MRWPIVLLNLLIFSTFLLGNSLSHAQENCRSVLDRQLPDIYSKAWSGPPPFEKFDEKLVAVNFEKYGFVLGPDKQSLYQVKKDKTTYLGKLMIAKTKYLFKWSDSEHQRALLRNGITAKNMHKILHTTGRTAGKGFYVSVHPFDSMVYGTEMTAFAQTKPLVALEFPFAQLDRFQTDAALVTALANAGVDALTHDTYIPTWVSVIAARDLSDPQTFPPDIIAFYISTPDGSDLLTDYAASGKIPVSAWSDIADSNPAKIHFLASH